VLRQGILRPSNLPKIKLCAWYRSQDEQSDAAARGSKIDRIFRDIIVGLRDFPDGTAAEIAAAVWAADQVDQIAGKYHVFADKTDCAVVIPGFQQAGEVDCLCPKLFASFDLKSGAYYDYELQMAAYSFGLMTKYFAETWTTWLIFCDLRRVYHYTFTYEQASRLVCEVRALYEAAAAPAYNPYCTFCANAGGCPVLINRADQVLALVEKPKFDFQGLLANPERLGYFLTACRAIEPLQQQAQDRVKQYLLAKTEVRGWSLVTRAPSKFVDSPAVVPLAEKLGSARVLQEYGHMSVAKYEKLCAEAGLSPDSAAIKMGAGATYLRSTPELTKKGGDQISEIYPRCSR
jgi:hypothetical protein